MVNAIEKAREDQKATILYYKDEGRHEGLKQGLEQGLEQGEWKEKIKIIENAVRIGLPLQTIMELTGLDEEKIRSLLPKMS